MPTDPRFPELVSLACHDLRTPLATVAGFAATLLRVGELDEKSHRYVTLIEAAALQLGGIIDELAVTARIEGGSFAPELEPADALDLAQAAAARVGEDRVLAAGTGARTLVDGDLVSRALAQIAKAALRHGGVERVELRVDGAQVTLAPVDPHAADVVLGRELRDLGSAAGKAAVEALGGTVTEGDGSIVVSLPTA
jgi:signal transduction histidine kinase